MISGGSGRTKLFLRDIGKTPRPNLQEQRQSIRDSTKRRRAFDYETDGNGMEDVLFYMKGSISSPVVSKVVKINLDDEFVLELNKGEIYERQGAIDKAFVDGVFTVYNASDFPYGGLQRGKSGQGSETDGRSEIGRGYANEVRADENESSVSETRFFYVQSRHYYSSREHGKATHHYPQQVLRLTSPAAHRIAIAAFSNRAIYSSLTSAETAQRSCVAARRMLFCQPLPMQRYRSCQFPLLPR